MVTDACVVRLRRLFHYEINQGFTRKEILAETDIRDRHMNTNRPVTKSSPTKMKQRGAVLIISLLVLLVLTLIGVSSLDSSILEEKMASNSQISTTAFQSAESAIREKYYEERVNPAMAVVHAQNGNTDNCDNCGVESSTEMVYPNPLGKPTLYNSSAGTFVAHGIEIIGSATYRGIQDSNAQGYSVYPMRP